MWSSIRNVLALRGLVLTALLVSACAPAAPAPTSAPAPTAAPATKAAATQQPPTAAPAAQPAATSVPAAKPAEARPAQPPTAAAASSPAAQAAAKPAFDEQAVASFYRGKTVRILVATTPGSGTDVSARIGAKYLKDLIPGQPNVVVVNTPGAGGFLAANAVYHVEPQDGTVIGALTEGVVLQQALGAPGKEFDAAKFQWLGSVISDVGSCIARTDTGVKSVQDLMDGKKLIIGAQAPGSTTFDIAAVLKAALGANIQIVAGYPGATAIVAAMEKKEVEGICLSFAGILLEAGDRLQSANPSVNYFVLMGPEPRQHPLSRGVPVAESLAKTEDAKQMIRAVGAAPTFLNSLTLGPSVPSDRVAALRQAFDRMVLNPEFKADIEKTQRQLGAKNWQQVTQIVQGVLNTSPEVLARLKEIMK